MRYVLEGVWKGPRTSYISYRDVIEDNRKVFLSWIKKNPCIYFSNGTILELKLRECEPHEKVFINPTYRSLVWDCFYFDVVTVDQLKKHKKERGLP